MEIRLQIGSSVLNNKLIVDMKIYVVLNIKDGKYDAILYHKDIHVLVSSCVIFVSHMGLYLQTVSLKTTLTASLFVKILTKREIKCMCIAMLISLQFIVFCETEIT